MPSLWKICIIGISLLDVACGQKVKGKVYVEETCSTTVGARKLQRVPTHVHHATETYTITNTKVQHPKTTITPPAVTLTQTEIIVTTLTKKGRASRNTVKVDKTTTTSISTTLDTVTSVFTSTASTSTVVGTTATIAAPNGFVPIQDSLPAGWTMQGDDGAPLKKRSQDSAAAEKRDQLVGGGGLVSRAKKAANRLLFQQTPCGNEKKKWPEVVNCDIVTSVPKAVHTTKRGKAITVTAPTPITVSTKKRTLTITSTSFPPDVTVLTTSTVTATVLITTIPVTSTTTTTTSTNTAYVATATAYAQCSHENFADYDSSSSSYVQGGYSDGPYNQVLLVADNAYECCSLCAQDPTCEIGFFQSGGSTNCYLELDPTAAHSTTNLVQWTAYKQSSNQLAYVIFNGNVGGFTSDS